MRRLLIAGVFMLEWYAVAQDYPQWRGRDRDGAASSFRTPKHWPEALKRKWRVEVGEGYATPIIIGGTVFTFTRRSGEETISAINAADGSIKWATGYPAPYDVSPAAKAHGPGPKATPLYYKGKLYTLGISGIVSAFDVASGKLLWQSPSPAEKPYFGTAVSPVAYKDIVIVHPGNYGPLTAFDVNSGAVRWRAGNGGNYASPMIAEFGGTAQVVTMSQKEVIGVSPSTGEVLWQHSWPSQDIQAITPLFNGDSIIVAGRNSGVAAFKPVRRDEKWGTELLWQTKDVSMFMSNPVLVRDTLYGLSHLSSGQFFALDTATGKVLWLGSPREATNTAIAKAGDFLLLLNEDAELIVAKASRAGFEPLKRYTVAESATWAQPAISGGRMFVKDVSSLALWLFD